MKKPTRRITLAAGCLALAAIVMSISGAQAIVHGSPGQQLDANRVAVAATHPILSAPALPVGPAPAASPASPATSPATSTTGSTVPATPITVVLPPAPGPAPAKADAATQVAVPAGNKSNGGGSAKKPTTGVAAGGGCPAGSYVGHADIANAVYSMINSERAANSLPALGRSGQLNSSAGAHNVAMADTNDFDHQVACESDLGARISATGYHWSSVGENIAWGSYASVSFAQSLEAQMYNEPPNQPNHRANILSISFHNVGVDVITDSTGKMWITCDFAS